MSSDAKSPVHAVFVAQEAHGPRANRRVGMLECAFDGRIFTGKARDSIKSPECVERAKSFVLFERSSQLCDCLRVLSFAQQLHGSLAMPFVWMRQKRDELIGGFAFEVRVLLEGRIFA